MEEYKFGETVDYLIDKGGNLSIYDVDQESLARNWRKTSEKDPTFGFTDHIHWFRFTAQNPGPKKLEWYLQQKYTGIDSLQLYIPDASSGSIKMIRLGDTYKFSDRKISHRTLAFPISTPAHETVTYYLQMKSRGPLNAQLVGWDPLNFHAARDSSSPFFWLYYGFLLLMAVINGILWFRFREINFGVYALYIFCFCLFVFSINGFSFQYLWPNSVWWANYSIPFFAGSRVTVFILFSRRFLDTPYKLGKFDLLLKALISLWFFEAIFALTMDQYKNSMLLIGYLSYLTTLITVPIVLYLLLGRKSRESGFYLPAYIVLILGSILLVFKNAGYTENSTIANFGYQIGSILEIILLTWGLIDKCSRQEEQSANRKHRSLHSERKQNYIAGTDVDLVIQNLTLAMEEKKAFNDEDLSLSNLAQELDVTAHQLSQILNEKMGKNFSTYINEYRVGEAAQMLMDEPKRSILSVGYAVGFNSKSGFNSAFKRILGVTPTKYRRSNRADL